MTFPVFGGNASGSSGCYVPTGKKLTKSLRFRNSASAYLSRTPSGTATDQQKWTISCWFKRGYNPSYGIIFSSAGYSFLRSGLYGNAIDFDFGYPDSGDRYTNAVYSDYSSWYHMVCVFDSTQANAYDRCQIYINGVLQSYNYGALPAQFSNSYWNTPGYIHTIGCLFNATQFFDGYLAEFYNIDGQALSPTSFGQTDPVTGAWVPINYTGTYGNFGFYLPFTDATSPTTLAQDQSGNGNDWTPNNISTTAGVTYDSMTDVPTLSASASNYCVWNPITYSGSTPTFTNGNLTFSSSSDCLVKGTIGITSGKWYWEGVTTSGSNAMHGLATMTATDPWCGGGPGSWGFYEVNGNVYYNTTPTSYGSSYSTGDVIGVAFDADAGKLYFSINGTWQNSGNPVAGTGYAFSGLTGNTYTPASGNYSNTNSFNFGQQPFTYTPPAGFLPLNTANLPCPTIWNGANVMAATLYTGTGSALTVTNGGNNPAGKTFYPDLVWAKNRTNAANNVLQDSVRGFGTFKNLSSNQTQAEGADSDGVVTGASSNSFTVDVGTSVGWGTDRSGDSYVAWQWNAGNGVTSTNTNGSITSTVSVNPTAGFSVVTYTGNYSSATVGHGLGVAPSMIIAKCINTGGTYWEVGHSAIGWNNYLTLNTTNAAFNSPPVWDSTAPTSTVFSLGADVNINGNGYTNVAYCWAAIPGYSAFGSYIGNNSTDGPFIYTGFRPRYIMAKCINTSGNWEVWDSSINPYNQTGNYLVPNDPIAEQGASYIQFLSNGFKLASTQTEVNGGGYTMIYAAFAENPFKYANAR